MTGTDQSGSKDDRWRWPGLKCTTMCSSPESFLIIAGFLGELCIACRTGGFRSSLSLSVPLIGLFCRLSFAKHRRHWSLTRFSLFCLFVYTRQNQNSNLDDLIMLLLVASVKPEFSLHIPLHLVIKRQIMNLLCLLLIILDLLLILFQFKIMSKFKALII